MSHDDATVSDGSVGTARRSLLRNVALAGAAVAASTLVPTGAAAAGTKGHHHGSPPQGANADVDTSHATSEVAKLFVRYFQDKTRADVDATMSYFSRSKITYVDATLGWPWYTWDELKALFAQYMPTWPATARSYPTRILGDSKSAVVIFTDTPELFGHQIRPLGFVNFERGKIVRWIDYWDGRDFTMADIVAQRTPADKFPHDFKEPTVGEQAASAMRRTAEALQAAFAARNAEAAARVFAYDAVFEDRTLHATIVGRQHIQAYLGRALNLLPYGPGSVVRHVVGSAIGGGYEWVNRSNPATHGGTALELDAAGRITRLTTAWDGSLVDKLVLTELLARSIEE